MRPAALAVCAGLALSVSLIAEAAIPNSERQALIALYDSTNGSSWTDSSNWNGAAGTECTWAGVQCDSEQTTVVGIYLYQNNLSGPIPSEIGSFPNLEELELWENELSGPIPPEIGSLTNLRHLILDNNGFEGTLPGEIGNLTNLELLQALGCGLSGAVPPEIGNLPSLDNLRLAFNALTSIPSEIGNLPVLTNLELNENLLSGPIPPEIGSISSLVSLDLSLNQFSGSIPSELGNLTNLYFLSVDHNELTGAIPPELGNATALGWLVLSRNQLSGEIPASLAQLTDLQYLELFSNQLTGSIPKEIGNLANLEVLRLGENELSGSIPSELGSLSNLLVLTLGNNQLTGDLPREIANLTSLAALELAANSISGPLPAELASLTKLEELVAYENQLTGPLPDTSRWTQMREILLGDNRLSGPIPPSITNLTELTTLGLQGNELSGPIPSDIGRLTKLENLWLFGNRLNGPIPPSIGELSNLISLRLDQNELAGQIPVSLADLQQIEELLLNDNRLDGPVPPQLGNLTSLFSLAIGSNLLAGEIPSSIGTLTNLVYLDISNNDLRGTVPADFLSLTNLIDNLSDFRFNAIRTGNSQLRQFLDQKQDGGDWESTQTVEPTGVQVVSTTDRSAIVRWNLIDYQSDPGGYRVSATPSTGGSAVVTTTPTKFDNEILVRGLASSTSYTFTVRTVTHPHGLQKNTVVSDSSQPATGMTAAAVVLPATIEVVRYPEGLIQRSGIPQNEDRFVLANRGDVSTTIDLSKVGDFFSQSPESFEMAPTSTRTISLSSIEQPAGSYEGESVPSGDGVPSGLTIPVRLLSSEDPGGSPKCSAEKSRVSTAGDKGTTTTGEVVFRNVGDATVSGVLVSDVAWISVTEDTITIEPGMSQTVRFTIDRAKRPDAADQGEGALTGTLSLVYLDDSGAGSLSASHAASQTTGVSTTLVTIVDTSKPAVTPSGIPALAPGEVAFVIPGVTRSSKGGGELVSDLSLVNSFAVSPLQDLRLYYSAPELGEARVATVQSLAPSQALSFASVVDGVYEAGESAGSIQLRSQRSQSVLSSATLLNQVGFGQVGMTLPVFRSDRGAGAGTRIILPGTRRSETTSTDLILQELTGEPASVSIEFLGVDGALVGPTLTRDLPAFGFMMLPDAVPSNAITTVVRNQEGSAGTVTAWGRTFDSISGDIWATADWPRTRAFDGGLPMKLPVIATERPTVSRQRPVRRPSGDAGQALAIESPIGARTELVLTNSGESPASAILRLFTASGSSSEIEVDLDPDQSTAFSDVAAALGHQGATGHLVIEPAGGRFSASARYVRNESLTDTGEQVEAAGLIGSTIPVLSDTAGLRLGQFLIVPFIDDSTEAHARERLAGTRRADVGLIECAGRSVTVRVSARIYDGSDLVSANVFRDFRLGPRETLYVENISTAIIGSERDALFGDLNDLQLEFRVIEGDGAVTPFVVAIDNATGDARFRLE